eukprot:Pgem_evm2s6868
MIFLYSLLCGRQGFYANLHTTSYTLIPEFISPKKFTFGYNVNLQPGLHLQWNGLSTVAIALNTNNKLKGWRENDSFMVSDGILLESYRRTSKHHGLEV